MEGIRLTDITHSVKPLIMNGVEEITVKLGKGYSELHLKCIDWPNVSVFVLLLFFNFSFSWMQMLLGWILEDIGFKEQKAKKSLYHYYFHSGIVFFLNIGFWLFFVRVKISSNEVTFSFSYDNVPHLWNRDETPFQEGVKWNWRPRFYKESFNMKLPMQSHLLLRSDIPV